MRALCISACDRSTLHSRQPRSATTIIIRVASLIPEGLSSSAPDWGKDHKDHMALILAWINLNLKQMAFKLRALNQSICVEALWRKHHVRDSAKAARDWDGRAEGKGVGEGEPEGGGRGEEEAQAEAAAEQSISCLLYTSDAADDM
eukprot:2106804-Rhodomonas_salina.1